MKKLVCLLFAVLAGIPTIAQQVNFHFTDGIYNASLKSKMEESVSALLTEINTAAAQGRGLRVDNIISQDAATRLNGIWENFGFVSQSEAKSICYGLVNGYQARGIQITVTRQPEDCNDPKTRELTVSFDKAGNITRVAFALLNNQLSVSDGKSQVDDVKRRNEILKFVEDYRNYFIEKDLNSLRRIYSDDALIITGKVIQTRDEGGDYANRIKTQIQYTKLDKEEHLRNLARVFRNNSYIDVKFDEIMITPANSKSMPNYYGVNLIQHYRSSTYNDDGYLFLLWDFNEDPPVIHIRAWQPEKTPNNEIIMIDDYR